MKKPILIISLLLIAAISIKAQDIFNALKSNDLAKVKLLIEKDATLINLKDEAGNTPLHHAAMIESVEMTELLLSKGVDINAQNT